MKTSNSPISMRPTQQKISQEYISNRKGGSNSPLAMPGGGVWGNPGEPHTPGVNKVTVVTGQHPKPRSF